MYNSFIVFLIFSLKIRFNVQFKIIVKLIFLAFCNFGSLKIASMIVCCTKKLPLPYCLCSWKVTQFLNSVLLSKICFAFTKNENINKHELNSIAYCNVYNQEDTIAILHGNPLITNVIKFDFFLATYTRIRIILIYYLRVYAQSRFLVYKFKRQNVSSSLLLNDSYLFVHKYRMESSQHIYNDMHYEVMSCSLF